MQTSDENHLYGMKLTWKGDMELFLDFFLALLVIIWALSWYKKNVFKWFVYS